MAGIDFPHCDDPEVTVVIVGWRRAPFLRECLQTLASTEQGVPFDVVVVLNEPAPEVAPVLARDVTGVRVRTFRANLGFAAACNQGARLSGARYLALLNDDARVHEGWLAALLATARRRPGAGAVASCLYHPDGRLQEAGCVVWSDGWTCQVGDGLPGDARRFRFERRVDYGSAGALLVARDAWDDVGGLSEDYYPAYFEDVDLGLALSAAGRPVWLSPRAEVTHVRASSTGAQFREFLHARNHARFRQTWQAELEGRHPCDPESAAASVEIATWLAQGAPPRLLLLDPPDGTDLRAVCAHLSGELGYRVSLCRSDPGAPLPDGVAGTRTDTRTDALTDALTDTLTDTLADALADALADDGIRVLDGPPADAFGSGQAFDAILALGGSQRSEVETVLRRYSPDVPCYTEVGDLPRTALSPRRGRGSPPWPSTVRPAPRAAGG